VYHAEARQVGTIEPGAVEVNAVVTTSRIAACPMEGRAAAADYDWTSGRLTFWSSTQMPGFFKSMLSMFLQVPENNITVITPDVGGGFGVKAALYTEELLVCVLSMELNRPISWVEDRREHFLTAAQAKQQVQDMTLTVAADGTFTGLKSHVYSDSGAYHCFPWTALVEPRVGFSTLTGVYKIPAVDTAYQVVATNRVAAGPYRGVGWTAANLAREVLIDEAARRLDLSPFEIRRTCRTTPTPGRSSGRAASSRAWTGSNRSSTTRRSWNVRRPPGPRAVSSVSGSASSTNAGGSAPGRSRRSASRCRPTTPRRCGWSRRARWS
jgi:CO/xanthine dehydrogenase Mo-binding subunit